MLKIVKILFIISLSLKCLKAQTLVESYRLATDRSNQDVSLGKNYGHIGGINLSIDHCDSFPFKGISESGVRNIKADLTFALETVATRIDQEKFIFPEYVLEKLRDLSTLLIDQNKEKTFHCRFGQTNSFIAIATSSVDDDGIEKYSMAPYPSIIFDTNRMAGNFPLDVDPEKFRLFYGQKLDGVTIEGGRRNPLYAKTNNSASLVFHEMMHWTGAKHFDKSFPDIVYLTQFCFFSHDNISITTSQQACSHLEDETLWQKDEVARLQAIENKQIREFIKETKKLYHSHY